MGLGRYILSRVCRSWLDLLHAVFASGNTEWGGGGKSSTNLQTFFAAPLPTHAAQASSTRSPTAARSSDRARFTRLFTVPAGTSSSTATSS